MSVAKTVWETLSVIDVGGHISYIIDPKKRRPDIPYIPWANAWTLMKRHYPDATRVIYEDQVNKCNFFTDGRTAYVKVGVRIDGLEHIDYLPIMDFKNDSMPLEKVTSMDVNKAIQRSTVKAIAMHGLGIQLWAKEEVLMEPVVAAQKAKTDTKDVLNSKHQNWDKVNGFVKESAAKGLDELIKILETRYKITAATKKTLGKVVEAVVEAEVSEAKAVKLGGDVVEKPSGEQPE